MGLWNTERSWGWPARLLHWLLAGVILFLLGLGIWMANFVEGMVTQLNLTQLHKSWGAVAFALVVLRLGWRALNRAPALPAGTSAWEAALARSTHAVLYVLMIAMPLSGWLFASASPLNDADNYPFQIKNMVFGLFELPDPFQPGSKELSEGLGAVHRYSGYLLALLVVGHIAAALKHQLLNRDGLIRRMILGQEQ